MKTTMVFLFVLFASFVGAAAPALGQSPVSPYPNVVQKTVTYRGVSKISYRTTERGPTPSWLVTSAPNEMIVQCDRRYECPSDGTFCFFNLITTEVGHMKHVDGLAYCRGDVKEF
ncbi:hypothetical protein BDV30DRAFT_226300 [Aspergillus minisclerotigenes]|uniref:Uncharacterized protein n=1 Tax=Aspergillus minisclerotigenes TaxID=656917 RepID=A0A5N6J6P4_9EURO|nr:hypothetical protein BDV30DRAFT_226300 [Aspergillus minisclerotigenes]